MSREFIDTEGLSSDSAESLRAHKAATAPPFEITKIGHAVLRVTDLERSVAFYTEMLGFAVTDVYPESMMPGGMVFMRFNADHHGLALVGGLDSVVSNAALHHMAFEVASLDEVIRARDHLRANDVVINYEGRRRAGCQVAVEFLDPDGHQLEIYWGLDQIGTDGRVRPPEEWRPEVTLAGALSNPPAGQDVMLRDSTLEP